jgi:hypothetical protein
LAFDLVGFDALAASSTYPLRLSSFFFTFAAAAAAAAAAVIVVAVVNLGLAQLDDPCEVDRQLPAYGCGFYYQQTHKLMLLNKLRGL